MANVCFMNRKGKTSYLENYCHSDMWKTTGHPLKVTPCLCHLSPFMIRKP